MDNSFDYSANTIATVNTIASQIVTGSDPYIGAVFHNLDSTNIIYIGKSNVLSGGQNGFALEGHDMVTWRGEGDLKDLYAVAGGGTNLKLSYVIFK
jgi:hypothetical protein